MKRITVVMLGLGLASGLPLPLIGFTLRQWMGESHVPLAWIGATASIGLPYSLKFLWAPLFDAVTPGLPGRRLGHWRGWLLIIQPLLALACLGLATGDPNAAPCLTLAAASLVAWLSASQDIAIDAWRIGAFPPEEQGRALAAYVWGYRLAMLAGTTGVLLLVRPFGWHGALAAASGAILAGVAVTLAAPATVHIAVPGGVQERLRLVRDALRDLARPGMGPALAFVALFHLGEVLAGTMAPAFYRAMGFDRAAVAQAMGVPSLLAALAGVAYGGRLVARLGASRALIRAGLAQTAAMGLYFALAVSRGLPMILYAKVVMETFAEAMADAAFLAYLSGLCRSRHAVATEYALLSSLATLGLRTVGGASGLLADAVGWSWFYALAMAAALPAMGIMMGMIHLENSRALRHDRFHDERTR